MFHCFNWHTIKLFVISYIAFAALNIGWFCYLMKDFYKAKLAGIAAMPEMGMGMFSNNHLLMFLAWALIVKGIIIFVLPRTKGDYICALVKGALYGLIIGGSYQLMNFAMIAGWPVEVVYYGIAWKMVLCAVITAFTVWVAEMCGCEFMCTSKCDERK